MEKIKKKIDKCVKALPKTSADISERLVKLFSRLSDFLREYPEFSEQAMPILLTLYHYIVEGNYSEASEQLFLLLVLIQLWRRKK